MSNLVTAYNAVPYTTHHGKHLAALDFDAEASTITCLVGPDLEPPMAYLRMLAALQPPYRGRLEILGMPTADMDRRAWRHLRTKTAFVAGDAPLLSVQNGLDNVMLPALYHRLAPAADVERKAVELLQRLGCRSDVNILPAFMSTLECYLVNLARALILEPRVLFLAHPFQDLDTEDRKFVANVLVDLKRQSRLGIITVVKNLPFVREHSDRILYASDSRVGCYNGWEEFAGSPDPEVQGYLKDEASA